MKKYIFSFLFILFFLGCRSSKEYLITQNDSLQIENISLQQKIISLQKEMIIVRDSLVFVKGLKEKSSYSGRDSISFLETTYAISFAKIQNGNLFHSLENKDSIPKQIKEKIIYKSTVDTFIQKDTIYRYIEKKDFSETQKVIEEKSIFEKFKDIIILCIIFCSILLFFKIKSK